MTELEKDLIEVLEKYASSEKGGSYLWIMLQDLKKKYLKDDD